MFKDQHCLAVARVVAASPLCIATTDLVGVLRLYVACSGSSPTLETAFQLQVCLSSVGSSTDFNCMLLALQWSRKSTSVNSPYLFHSGLL